MVCIYCGDNTKVTNSRPQKRKNHIWRRRVCLNCSTVFTSIEQADYSASIVVRKNNTIEPFHRDKLLLSLHESLKHRQNSHVDAAAITETIIARLCVKISNASLTPEQINMTVIEVLGNFDNTAATHYKAFHPR